jgi:glutamyl-tRNA reductase
VRERRYRPILFVDIAVPRDIDPQVADLDNVFLYDVDDLERVLVSNREARAREAAAAERMIGEEVVAFSRWSRSQQVVPVIKALRAQASAIAEAEIERTLAAARTADPRTQQSVRAMGQAIVNKLLHPVLTRLKSEGAAGDPEVLVDSLVSLFGLDLAPFIEDARSGAASTEPEQDTSQQPPPRASARAAQPPGTVVPLRAPEPQGPE